MNREVAAELGVILRGAGYSSEAIAPAIGVSGPLVAVRGSDVPAALRQLTADPPLSTLVRLLLLEQVVALPEAERALAPLQLDRLEEAGVLERVDGGVRATMRFIPYEALVLACDPEPRDTPDPDYVPPPNLSSVQLDRLAPRRPAETALDVGTGTGLQALHVAAESGQVIATDLNQRALDYAGFNAALNGIENVELRAGSFFEPVEGQQFDLALCNPPFIISPGSELLYRDSGKAGDTVSQEIVRGIPAFLKEGGFGCVGISWALKGGEEWSTPLRRWVEGNGCDALLLHFWTDETLRTAYAFHPQAPQQWLDYYQELGIESIGYGAVVLRRRSGGPNWVRAERLPAARFGSASGEIVQFFDTQDTLSGMSDLRDLLGVRLALADVSLLEASSPSEGMWELREMMLELDAGLRFQVRIDPVIARLLPLCDGRSTLGEALNLLWDDLEAPQDERDGANAKVLPPLKRLVELGFLIPAA